MLQYIVSFSFLSIAHLQLDHLLMVRNGPWLEGIDVLSQVLYIYELVLRIPHIN